MTHIVQNQDCIFCKIIRKELPAEIISENDYFLTIVDIAPNNFGHSLIIPKNHYKDIHEMSEEVLSHLGIEMKRLSNAVKKAVQADGINIHMNNGKAAGQIIFHAHLHIIPRFENDGFHHWPQKSYRSPEEMREIGEKIRASI